VDDYKLGIYNSLKIRQNDSRFSPDFHLVREAAALVGYMSGNSAQPGCLTSDCNVRLHCCERGNMCAVATGASAVRIQPIIAHLPSGADLAEVGVGGGGDDLKRDAELDLSATGDITTLLDV
jgi:DNA cross-link repair 1C protein